MHTSAPSPQTIPGETPGTPGTNRRNPATMRAAGRHDTGDKPGTYRGQTGDTHSPTASPGPTPCHQSHGQALDLVQLVGQRQPLALIASPKPQHPSPPGCTAAPRRPLAHLAGMQRKGTSPGASSSRRVHLWITFQTCTHTYLLKKQAVWTSSQAHDSQRVFPIMCNTCSIAHIRQRALCKQSVLYRAYSAHYRENQVSCPDTPKGATHDH
ncbi:hypothetical protein HPF_04605 [Hydrogenophaga pseudoflava]|uniref:Uncharacterized protein n=1 Tax=Hydrogenophaga pseudoflava TaxID=47421 RepID=A0A4P6WT30_HYDPS|nr:hypothetical protein HPF_04605 [Hydrogenophaga pseudoflava]